MNLTISITQPLIIGSQQIKVEYSTDGVTYTFDSYQSSNTFTTTFGGFVAGTLYYFRFTLVKSLSPLVECDAVVKTYFIPEDQPCLTLTGTLTKSGDNWSLEISYSTPSPYTAPCGGYILKYGTAAPLTSIYYATMPASPLVFPASNQTYYVELYSLDCDGNQVLCQELTVPPTIASCTPATVTAELINSSGFKLKFTVVPSVPGASHYVVSYSQANSVQSGVNDPGANVQLNATGANPDIFFINVNPNTNIYGITISYYGSITDGCGGTIPFDVSVNI